MTMQWERYKWLELIPHSVPPPKASCMGWMLNYFHRAQLTRSLQKLTFAEVKEHLERCFALDFALDVRDPGPQYPASAPPPTSDPSRMSFPDQNMNLPQSETSDFDTWLPPNSDRPPWDYRF